MITTIFAATMLVNAVWQVRAHRDPDLRRRYAPLSTVLETAYATFAMGWAAGILIAKALEVLP